MSGLSSGQFADYLIIGIITSIFAALLDVFLKSNNVKGKMRSAAVACLIVVAVGIGYWRLRERSKEEANIRGGGRDGSGGGWLLPTGTLPMTPSSTHANANERELCRLVCTRAHRRTGQGFAPKRAMGGGDLGTGQPGKLPQTCHSVCVNDRRRGTFHSGHLPSVRHPWNRVRWGSSRLTPHCRGG